jgi:hypothetical protein
LSQASPTDWHGSEPGHGPAGTLGLYLKRLAKPQGRRGEKTT